MTVSIGQEAPDFDLPDTEGRSWSADSAEAPATAVVFTCNH
jgi:peroxiredoxin